MQQVLLLYCSNQDSFQQWLNSHSDSLQMLECGSVVIQLAAIPCARLKKLRLSESGLTSTSVFQTLQQQLSWSLCPLMT